MMSLCKPFRAVNAPLSLDREIDRLFRDFALPALDLRTAAAAPASDIAETKDAFRVTIDLPGHLPEDIHVSVENDVLTVRSERKAPKEEDGTAYHRTEIGYGSYVRTFSLPSLVDSAKVDAKYEHGVLCITLPKRDEVKPRSVEIKVA